MMLLTGKARTQDEAEKPPPLVRWMRGPYETLLVRIAKRPGTVMLAAAAFTVGGSLLLPFFGSAFLPEFKEGHYTLHMSAVPGTSIANPSDLGSS